MLIFADSPFIIATSVRPAGTRIARLASKVMPFFPDALTSAAPGPSLRIGMREIPYFSTTSSGSGAPKMHHPSSSFDTTNSLGDDLYSCDTFHFDIFADPTGHGMVSAFVAGACVAFAKTVTLSGDHNSTWTEADS